MLIASCSLALPADLSQGLPMLPLGEFRAMDGRPSDVPTWILRPERAAAIAAAVAADPRARPIDYEHQTLLSRENGQPAPAAGRFHQLGIRGDFLAALDVQWTQRASAMIAANEYFYLSPVFSYNPRTGEVIDLLHAGLTNTPALANLGEIRLAAASRFYQSTEALRRIMKAETLSLLQLDPQASDDEIHTAIVSLTAKLAADEQQITALKTPDPTQWMPVTVVADLRTQLEAERILVAKLRTEQEAAEKAALIAAAKADGRLLGDAMIAYAETQPLAALKALLQVLTPIAALKGPQTGGKAPPGVNALTDPTAIAIAARKLIGEQAGQGVQLTAAKAVQMVTGA